MHQADHDGLRVLPARKVEDIIEDEFTFIFESLQYLVEDLLDLEEYVVELFQKETDNTKPSVG